MAKAVEKAVRKPVAKNPKAKSTYQRPERIRKPKTKAEARNMIRRAEAMLRAAGAR
jgi:hypothetical protein